MDRILPVDTGEGAGKQVCLWGSARTRVTWMDGDTLSQNSGDNSKYYALNHVTGKPPGPAG